MKIAAELPVRHGEYYKSLINKVLYPPPVGGDSF